MKNMIIFINLIIIFVVTAIFSTPPKKRDEGKRAVATQVSASDKAQSGFDVNVPKSYHQFIVDDIVSKFIVEASDARLMDLEEGKIATQRSTTRELKDYGKLMLEDQSRMLAELKIIAARKKVKVASVLSEKKAAGLADLKNAHGRSFDKKFIKMMILDHKRDVKMLERATRSNDVDIKLFATKYLPVVQSHLDKIRSLKKKI
jgi:putative membrane protein